MLDDAPGDPGSVYEAVGGWPAFRLLVDEFYSRVETDAVLRPLYPDELTASKEHLALFLAMFFGGPEVYFERRGHPRLRARHFPFAIGKPERDAWVRNMLAAVDAAGIEEPSRTKMIDYFENAASFLINRDEFGNFA